MGPDIETRTIVQGRIELPLDVASVARARAFIRSHLGNEGWLDVAEVVTLLTSELVTNAVRHARTPCSVELRAADATVHIEVGDGSPTLVTPRHPGQHEESGRGLELVDCLSAVWGCTPWPAGDGKTVWFAVQDARLA